MGKRKRRAKPQGAILRMFGGDRDKMLAWLRENIPPGSRKGVMVEEGRLKIIYSPYVKIDGKITVRRRI